MSVRRSSLRLKPVATPKETFLGRLLDSIDRLSETIYSIHILLTFTLVFRIFKLGTDSGQTVSAEYVNELLIAAVGAILAWGIIDGLMYALMAAFVLTWDLGIFGVVFGILTIIASFRVRSAG